VRVPDEVGLGMAKVKLSFSDWREGQVVPAIVEMRVVDEEPKKGPKP
jgi:hypothetical protein